LFQTQRIAFGIGQEAVSGPSDVADVEGDGSDFGGAGIKFLVGQGATPAF